MLHAMCSEANRADRCQSARPANAPRAGSFGEGRGSLRKMQSAYGNQAMIHLLGSSPSGAGTLRRKCECPHGGTDCPECKKKKEEGGLHRSAAPGAGSVSGVPPIVHDVVSGPGRPLDAATRSFMEPRFGHDFSKVRIHTDAKAAESADAVNAHAYTVGRDIVFAQGRYSAGAQSRQLLAHELTHVAQQGSGESTAAQSIGPENDAYEREAESVANHIAGGHHASARVQMAESGALQRTPAKKVSCAPGPLHLPNGTDIADPVAVITAAENRANQLFDQAIAELDAARQQILAGATIGWPTISDALGFGLRLMGLDPNSAHVWKDAGIGTAALLLRRLRAIRGTIGSGSFFFTCLGPPSGTIGTCSGDICKDAEARSCAGSFLIDFCELFWTTTAEDQAAAVIHESSHNFASFIQDPTRRGEGTAECYARFVQTVGGSNVQGQRTDLCPDPPP